VLGFVQPVDPEVNRVVELGKRGTDFLTGDEIRPLAQAIEQLEATVEGIVVGDGHQVHSPALGRRVDIQGPGIAIPAAQEAEVLGPPRVKAVAVHISLQQLVGLSLKHKMVY
jgi:hypothetical protein